MKVLFIGGTGTISYSITKLLSENNIDLTVLNRGNTPKELPENITLWRADINDTDTIRKRLCQNRFDVIADFIAFTPDQIERDISLFEKHCSQYIFISSASAYQKPLSDYRITESTPLCNPYWAYSRDKIACEERLMKQYRSTGFPITIVRPSHTYADGSLPLAMHSPRGVWTDIERMRQGRPLVVPGDGETLWTVTHSQDFAKGFVGLLGHTHAIGQAVHITADESLTWNQIYQTIGSALGVTPRLVHVATTTLVRLDPMLDGPLHGDKSRSVVFDNSKIKRLVPDYCATIRFDQGVHQSLDCLQNQPERQIFDPIWDNFLDRVIDVAGPDAISSRFGRLADGLDAATDRPSGPSIS